MKTFNALAFGLLMVLLVAGCARKKLSGVYMYKQGSLYAKYEFYPDGTVKYKSDLSGKFYHTLSCSGAYIIKRNVITASLHGMMDFTVATNFQTGFKMQGKDLVTIWSIGGNGQSNAVDQVKFVKQSQ
jgi:hypothetical protein